MSRQVYGFFISGEILARSDGKYIDKAPYLDFLLDTPPNSICLFTHLNSNFATLMRRIGLKKEDGEKIYKKEKMTSLFPYEVEYVPNRYCAIKRDNRFVFIADANQYAQLEWETKWKLDDCIDIAKKTAQIGIEVQKALEAIGLNPKSLSSPVGVFEKERNIYSDIPNINDIPQEVAEMAYACVDGSWLEAFNIGHYPCYDYDIISAYPHQLSLLKDTRLGKWIKTSRKEPDALYGFYYTKATIYSKFSPDNFKLTTGSSDENYTPVGTWERPRTLNTLKFMDRFKTGDYRIDYGYCWIPNGETKLLKFNDEIFTLNRIKEYSAGLSRKIYKRIMAGMWGKTLQVKDSNFQGKAPDTFNPVYGAVVENNVRLQVASYALINNVIPLHVAVDGAIFSTQLPTTSPKMGRWRLERQSSCFVLGSGKVAIKGEEKDGDFSLRYDWLEKQIQNSPKSDCYELKKMSYNTLAVTLNTGKWEDLGLIREIKMTVNIGGDNKRMYKERPVCGEDMYKRYDSEPLSVGMIK
jgi:hypothetical protein